MLLGGRDTDSDFLDREVVAAVEHLGVISLCGLEAGDCILEVVHFVCSDFEKYEDLLMVGRLG